MDPELQSTVKEGDVENLKKLCESRPHEFFLTRDESPYKDTLLHFVCKENPSFIKEALEILPVPVVRQLICQTDSLGNLPLHVISIRDIKGDYCRLLVDAYNRSSDVVGGDDLSSCLLLRVKNKKGEVPAEFAVRKKRDEAAAFLISLDPDIFKFVDAGKLLRASILNGCIRTVNVILTSNYGHSIEGFDPSRIKNECHNSDERCLSLLQHHPEIVNYLNHSGKTQVIGVATKIGIVDVVKTILNIDISNSYTLLIGHDISKDKNLLNIAVENLNLETVGLEIVGLILDAFNKSREHQAQKEREAVIRSNYKRRSFWIEKEEDLPVSATVSLLSFQPLWSQPYDETGKTTLSVAFCKRHWKLALDMLVSDLALLSDLADIYEEPAMIPAMEQQDSRNYIEEHMRQIDKTRIMYVYREAFLRFLTKNSDDKSRKLIKKYPELIRFKDTSGRSMLQFLVDENDIEAMILILKIHPSTYIETQPGKHEHLLMGVCRKGNLSAIQAICANLPSCPQVAICHQDKTTVLHNVSLKNLQEYRSLLCIPTIACLKNKTDAQGRSPLIKAIKEDNIDLAQALLEMDGIDVMDIRSPEGRTAAQMLREKCKESKEWVTLYNNVKQALKFLNVETDLKEMRNTLSVVAALLATITFAAAFTVPGGFNQNTGDLFFGQRASFIVFILVDTYAMCCSMIVLYSLIWSMVWDADKALFLIDRSVSVLHQSLYGTLVAFMTGVYTMMSHKSLWVAIIVCVMSSCVPIIANRRFLVTVLDNFVSTSRPDRSRPRTESGIGPALSADSSIDPVLSADSSIDPALSADSYIDPALSTETNMSQSMSAILIQG